MEIFKISQSASQRTLFLLKSQQASCFHQLVGRPMMLDSDGQYLLE